jgi:hypothetical protein
VDKEALVFVAEIVAKDALDAVAFLLYDQFGEVIVMDASHVDVGVAIPGSGYGLGGQDTVQDEKGTYQ